MKYALKFTVEVRVPILLRRPWWKFWGRDEIGTSTSWRIISLEGLTQYQADHVIHMHGNAELSELLMAIVNRGEDHMVDLKLYTAHDQPYAPIRVVDPDEDAVPQGFKPWRPHIRDHQ